MPGGDRTGPRGQGPMTGGGRGYCAGFNVPGYRAFNRGWGGGWRHQYYATGVPGWARSGPLPYEDSAGEIAQSLKEILRRLDALEGKAGEEQRA